MNKKTIVIVVIVGIVLMCLAAICGASLYATAMDTTQETTKILTEQQLTKPVIEPTEEIKEEPTAAPTETPTEIPTETPTEIPTEIPTETPTKVPTPRPTPTENSDAELLAFAEYTMDFLDDQSGLMDDFVSVFTDAGNNPLVVFESWWQRDTIRVADETIESCEDYQSADPPVLFIEVHREMSLACDDLVSASQNMKEYAENPTIDQRGIDLISEAVEHISSATEHMTTAADMVGALTIN